MAAKAWAIVAVWVFYGVFVAFCGVMTRSVDYTFFVFLGGMIPAGIATAVIRKIK